MSTATPPQQQHADIEALIECIRTGNVEAFNNARAAANYASIDLSAWDGDIPVCPENNARFIASLKIQPHRLYDFLKQGIRELQEDQIKDRLHEHYLYNDQIKEFLRDINWRGITLNPQVFAAHHGRGTPEFFNKYRQDNPNAPIDMGWINNTPDWRDGYGRQRRAHLQGYNLSGIDLTGISDIEAALAGCKIKQLHHARVTKNQANTLLKRNILMRKEIAAHLTIDGVVPPELEQETTRWQDIRRNNSALTPAWFYDHSFGRNGALTALWPGDADYEYNLNAFQHKLGVGNFSGYKEFNEVIIGGLSYKIMEDVNDNKTIRQYIAQSGQTIHATIEEAAAEVRARATSTELPTACIAAGGGASGGVLEDKIRGLV